MLADVQSSRDDRGLTIDEVGISGVRYPVAVRDRRLGKQETIGLFSLAVRLGAETRGAHMSRFVEVLGEHMAEVSAFTLPRILDTLCVRLGTTRSAIRVAFPYFLERVAPVSGSKALMDYDCEFAACRDHDRYHVALTVRVPVTSVCPCSKEISDYGAHNQRGYITVSVSSESFDRGVDELVWIEDLVDIAERSASAPLMPLVKRVDERALTMQAYDNPVFVEDMVRSVVTLLEADARTTAYRVEAENDESIHNHSAFARLSSASYVQVWPAP